MMKHDADIATLREKLIQLIDMDLEMIAEDIPDAEDCYDIPKWIAMIDRYYNADYNPILSLLEDHENTKGIPA